MAKVKITIEVEYQRSKWTSVSMNTSGKTTAFEVLGILEYFKKQVQLNLHENISSGEKKESEVPNG